MSSIDSVRLLRVLLVPERAIGLDVHLCLNISGEPVGLHVRNCVAVTTDGSQATHSLALDKGVWAKILGGSLSIDVALHQQLASVDGDVARVRAALTVFDVPGLE